jgi:hypothetical protein
MSYVAKFFEEDNSNQNYTISPLVTFYKKTDRRRRNPIILTQNEKISVIYNDEEETFNNYNQPEYGDNDVTGTLYNAISDDGINITYIQVNVDGVIEDIYINKISLIKKFDASNTALNNEEIMNNNITTGGRKKSSPMKKKVSTKKRSTVKKSLSSIKKRVSAKKKSTVKKSSPTKKNVSTKKRSTVKKSSSTKKRSSTKKKSTNKSSSAKKRVSTKKKSTTKK